MSFWIPKRKGRIDPNRHKLSESEQKILSRIDGSTSMQRLTMLPGMDAESVTTMVSRFVEMGLVEGDQGPTSGSSQPKPASQAPDQRKKIQASANRVSLKRKRSGESSVKQPASKPLLTPAPPTTDEPAVPAPVLTPVMKPEPPAAEQPEPPAAELPEPPAAEQPEPPAAELPEPPAAELPEPPAAELPEPPSALSKGASAAARARELVRAQAEDAAPPPKKEKSDPQQEKEKPAEEQKPAEEELSDASPELQTTAESVGWQPLGGVGPAVEPLDLDEDSMPIEHIPTYSLAEAAAELSDLAAISAPPEEPKKPKVTTPKLLPSLAKLMPPGESKPPMESEEPAQLAKQPALSKEPRTTSKPELPTLPKLPELPELPEPRQEAARSPKASVVKKPPRPLDPEPSGTGEVDLSSPDTSTLEAMGTGELDLSDPDSGISSAPKPKPAPPMDSEPEPAVKRPAEPKPSTAPPPLGDSPVVDAIAAARAQMAAITGSEPEEDSVLVNALAVAKAAMKAAGEEAARVEGSEDERRILVQGQGAAMEGDQKKKNEEVKELSEEKTGSFRKLFETKLSHLPKEQRAEIALMVSGDTLCAFCFDPWPGVIKSVLENPLSALTQARLIAQHHDKAMGLDHLGQRAVLLRDRVVQRHLLRNRQSSEPLIKKVLRNKGMHDLFRMCHGGEMTERSKRTARLTLRTKFMHAGAEDKLAVIIKTEGRCLLTVVGIPFDEKLTVLLCRRTYLSVPLVKNLAKHAVTPQNVIRHLWKEQLVRRTKHLQQSLLQHPNCPGEYKR